MRKMIDNQDLNDTKKYTRRVNEMNDTKTMSKNELQTLTMLQTTD